MRRSDMVMLTGPPELETSVSVVCTVPLERMLR